MNPKLFTLASLGLFVACAANTAPTPPAPTANGINLWTLTKMDGLVADAMRQQGFTLTSSETAPENFDGLLIDGGHFNADQYAAANSKIRAAFDGGKWIVMLDADADDDIGSIVKVFGIASKQDHYGVAFHKTGSNGISEFRFSAADTDTINVLEQSSSFTSQLRSAITQFKNAGSGAKVTYDQTNCPDAQQTGNERPSRICFVSIALADKSIYIDAAKTPRRVGGGPNNEREEFFNPKDVPNGKFLLGQINPLVRLWAFWDNRDAQKGGGWVYVQSSASFDGPPVVAGGVKQGDTTALSAWTGRDISKIDHCAFNSGTETWNFRGPYFMGLEYTAKLSNLDGSALPNLGFALMQSAPANVNGLTEFESEVGTEVGFSASASAGGISGGGEFSYSTSSTIRNSIKDWITLNRSAAGTMRIKYLSNSPKAAPLDVASSENAETRFDGDYQQVLSKDGTGDWNPFNAGQTISWQSAALWRIQKDLSGSAPLGGLLFTPSAKFRYQVNNYVNTAWCDPYSRTLRSSFWVNPSTGYLSPLQIDLETLKNAK
jgi:hypothetical protein